MEKIKFNSKFIMDLYKKSDSFSLDLVVDPMEPDRGEAALAIGYLVKFDRVEIDPESVQKIAYLLNDPYKIVRLNAAKSLVMFFNKSPDILIEMDVYLNGFVETKKLSEKITKHKQKLKQDWEKLNSKLKDKEKEEQLELAKGYEKALNYHMALEIYKSLDMEEKVMELFGEKFGKWGKVAEMHLARDEDEKAAEIYQNKLANLEMAAKIYESLKMWEKARKCRESVVVIEEPTGRKKKKKKEPEKPKRTLKKKKQEDLETEDYQWGSFAGYKLNKKIGSGGFSEVYIVTQFDSSYAMKIPRGISIDGSETIDLKRSELGRCVKEAHIWAKLTQNEPDTVVNLIEAGTDPFPWFVMEIAETTLRKQMGALEYKQALSLSKDLLQKLDRIHHYSVIHKDIKPENILKVDGEWKFSDFGLSKVIGTASQASQVLSGTMQYMAPEQISKKFGRTDWRTDIWQMGVLTYELLTNHRPFQADDPMEISMAILHEEPIPGTEFGMEPAVWDVVKKALEKDRKNRWESAGVFGRELG